MDAQVYDLLKETLALAGTLGVSFLGTIHALKRWQAGREAKDVQQDARLVRLEERPCCVRASGTLPPVQLVSSPLSDAGDVLATIPGQSKVGG